MKTPPVVQIASLCVAGLASGYVGHRLMPGRSEASPEAEVSTASGSLATSAASSSSERASAVPVAKAKPSGPLSSDTLESVMAIEGEPTFQRLAAWMMQASEPEIAAYWQFYRQKKNRSNDINDLIFINWTRLDPQAAIAASNGTPDEHYAWWAWTCHDPKQALATVMATRPERLNNVAWALGEFHAEWVMEHFKEIPEKGRDNAIRGMTKWDDSPDPKRILDFLKEQGRGFNARMFKSLVRKDPWVAYEWLKENEGVLANRGGPEQGAHLLAETMKESSPEMLEQFASRLPAGEMKRKVEALVFESLVASDPDQALAEASATKSSAVAVNRFATVGLALVDKDPDRAMEVARQMFEAHPDGLMVRSIVARPNGMSSSSSPDETASKLVDRLLTIDPAAVMEMQPVSTSEESFDRVADKWATRDLTAYAEWVNKQPASKTRDVAAGVVINRLHREAHFEEATEWAMSSEALRQTHLQYLVSSWRRTNPTAAEEWLKSAPLTEKEREQFQSRHQP